MHTIMGLLAQLWGKNPDMRLVQLCYYVEAESAKRCGAEPRSDIFYLDDDDFLEQLQIILEKEIKPVDPFFI